MINKSGLNAPHASVLHEFASVIMDSRPLSAGDWADPNKHIPGWVIVKEPQAGDVVAVKATGWTDASGHVAIMVSETESIGASSQGVKRSNFGSRSYDLNKYPGNEGYVYRRYVGFSDRPNPPMHNLPKY